MKAAFAFALLILLCTTLGAESDRLSMATWNLENYLLQNRWEHEQFRFDYPKPEEEKAIIRRQLLLVKPDVLLLQEIGSDAMLKELQEDLAASGLNYPFRHVGLRPDARSGLAILSKVGPDEVLLLEPSEADARVLRGIQEIVLRFDDQRLRIFHVHLKSRYTSDQADPDSVTFRTRELGLLQSFLAQRLALTEETDTFLLVGDFNTPFDSPLLEGLRQHWSPLHPVDARAEAWTYHHFKTGTRETIDGFWQPHQQSGFHPVGLFPLTRERPNGSDHRLVVIEWWR